MGIQSESSSEERRYDLDGGLTVVVHGSSVEVRENGRVLGANHQLILRPDEGGTCPSDGFLGIVGSGRRFTIDQQRCSGWMSINESMTFEHDVHADDVRLVELKVRYLDRTEPGREPGEFVCFPQNFGALRLGDVDIAVLYRHLDSCAKMAR